MVLSPRRNTRNAAKITVISRRKASMKYGPPSSSVSLEWLGGATSKNVVANHNKENQQPTNNLGRWNQSERLAFLRGLREHGKSQWKKIAMTIPTRDTVQVKTHAQTVLKLKEEGRDIFQELNRYEQQERKILAEKKTPQLNRSSSLTPAATSPPLVWKNEDFEIAKALIMLKGSKLLF